jgi:hypothetical protein
MLLLLFYVKFVVTSVTLGLLFVFFLVDYLDFWVVIFSFVVLFCWACVQVYYNMRSISNTSDYICTTDYLYGSIQKTQY